MGVSQRIHNPAELYHPDEPGIVLELQEVVSAEADERFPPL
jgi:hypothetical protein